MNVHQLSIAYVPEQDRVLVRVNTQEGKELQCWLTRRITLGMAPLIDKALTGQVARRGGVDPSHLAAMDEMSRKVVAQFQRNETLKSADFSTPYKAGPAGTALFDTPLLVTEINIATLGNGQLRLHFAEKLAVGNPAHRNFQMALSEQLVQAFVHLLERAVQQSQWRDVPAASPPAAADGPEKPGYLN